MTGLARVRDVAVVGAGIAALAAAIAFRRGLPDARVMLFSGADAGPDYPGAAAAFLHRFHRLVGLDEGLFRRRAGAVTVGESDFQRGELAPLRFIPVEELPYVDGAALHQLWLRRSAEGSGPGWNEVARRAAARAGVDGLGVRFDGAAYQALLAEMATSIGVELRPEAPEAASLTAEFDLVISAERDAADRAELHGVPGTFAWTVGKPGAESSAVERIRLGAGEATWSTPAWQAEARWAADSATAGRVVQAMDGKLLRVGRAAVQCETFDGQPLAVALAGIVRALELLPRPGGSGREAAEYNRRSAIVHDFLLDWAAARWGLAGSVPSGLAALRTQFSERGRIPFRDEDPLPPGHWISWFLANGTLPRQADLTAMAMSEERLSEVFRGV